MLVVAAVAAAAEGEERIDQAQLSEVWEEGATSLVVK
jgi:hypothetical protein